MRSPAHPIILKYVGFLVRYFAWPPSCCTSVSHEGTCALTLATHLMRRGAVYYWRPRLMPAPTGLASCSLIPDAVRAARMISDSGTRAFASLSRASNKLCTWLASSMACCTTPAFSNTLGGQSVQCFVSHVSHFAFGLGFKMAADRLEGDLSAARVDQYRFVTICSRILFLVIRRRLLSLVGQPSACCCEAPLSVRRHM